MKKSVYISLFLIATISGLFAQTSANSNPENTVVCDAVLENAKQLFELGNYEECISLLKSALRTCHFSKKKKEKMIELLTTTYIEKDELSSADTNFRKLLLNNPDYSIQDYSGIDEFSRLLKSYYVYPTFSISANGQFSKQNYFSSKIYSVNPQNNYDTKYQSELNYNGFIRLEQRVKENLSFNIDFSSNNLSHSREIKSENSTINFSEKTNYIQTAIGVNFIFNTSKKFNYYIGAYSGINYLLGNAISIKQEKEKLKNPFGYEMENIKNELQSYDFSIARNRWVYLSGMKIGASMRVSSWFFTSELNINYTVNTLNDKNYRFYDDKLIEEYSYIDNDIKLLNALFSVGFGRHFTYKVKNIKNENTDY